MEDKDMPRPKKNGWTANARNKRRAARGEAVIRAWHVQAHGEGLPRSIPRGMLDEAVTDAIVDILHTLGRAGRTWDQEDQIYSRSLLHYIAERGNTTTPNITPGLLRHSADLD